MLERMQWLAMLDEWRSIVSNATHAVLDLVPGVANDALYEAQVRKTVAMLIVLGLVALASIVCEVGLRCHRKAVQLGQQLPP